MCLFPVLLWSYLFPVYSCSFNFLSISLLIEFLPCLESVHLCHYIDFSHLCPICLLTCVFKSYDLLCFCQFSCDCHLCLPCVVTCTCVCHLCLTFVPCSVPPASSSFFLVRSPFMIWLILLLSFCSCLSFLLASVNLHVFCNWVLLPFFSPNDSYSRRR